jgi:hypothetical protein
MAGRTGAMPVTASLMRPPNCRAKGLSARGRLDAATGRYRRQHRAIDALRRFQPTGLFAKLGGPFGKRWAAQAEWWDELFHRLEKLGTPPG